MHGKSIVIFMLLVAGCCGAAAGAGREETGIAVTGDALTADPLSIELYDEENPGERIVISSDEYPQSPDEVFLLSATASFEESKAFQERYRIRQDLVSVTMRAAAPEMADTALLQRKLREYACRNRCNYVRELRVIVSSDTERTDYYASASGICGYGTSQPQFDSWMAAVTQDELLHCPFSEKYSAMLATYDHSRLSSLDYWCFVNEYELLKRDNQADYLIFRELEQKYLKAARKCGITQLRSLDEAVRIDMPKAIRRGEATVRR